MVNFIFLFILCLFCAIGNTYYYAAWSTGSGVALFTGATELTSPVEAGFLTVYEEGRDVKTEDDDSNMLPVLTLGEFVALERLDAEQHFTEPPPRYSEASLVKKLEELGIGRPSTYAAIISVLQDRGYVKLDRKRFFPEERGRVVTTFLKELMIT